MSVRRSVSVDVERVAGGLMAAGMSAPSGVAGAVCRNA
jgi:hypothetical protein